MNKESTSSASSVDYQSILFGMISGYALHEMIFDRNGLPVDYRFLDVNPAFERMTGLSREALIGKRVLEILPATEDIWIKRYGKVALTGQSDSFESYAVEFDKYFEVAAFCPKLGQFAVTFSDITAQKNAQRELRRQNRRLKTIETELNAIYQSAPILMFVVNTERRVVKLNKATLALAGLTEEAALGCRVGELFNCVRAAGGNCGYGRECTSCLVRNCILDTLENGTVYQGKQSTLILATKQSPSQRQLMLSSSPLEQGDSSRALICIVDVTDYFQEKKLRQESERLYRTLVEEGSDGIFIHRKNQIAYLNQQMAELVGCEPDELLGTSFLKFVANSSQQLVQDYIADSETGIYEVNFQKQDGTMFTAEAFGSPCEYRGDRARIVAVRDISRRKKAEAQLQASEMRCAGLYRQFEALLNAISDPIALLTTEMELLWINQAYLQAREVLGSCEAGLTFRQFFAEKEKYPVLRCIDTGKLAEEELATPDGRFWRVRAFPLFAENNELQQVLAVCVDISEKQRLLEESKRSSRMASLGILAAGVAHEINNPNALILYNSDILLTVFQELLPCLRQHLPDSDDACFGGLDLSELEHEVPGMLTAMNEGAKRIRRIVEDLRDYSRTDTGEFDEQVDLNQVAQGAVRLMHNSIKQNTDHFTLKLADDLPAIRGNSGRLEQVVINLLLNACQALEDSTRKIELNTHVDTEQRQLILQVCDQGCGIAPEVLEHLTEPFVTTKRQQGGTGLGLSVSARIVKEHDGQLVFKSQLGGGTCVSLVLPIL